MTLGGTLASTDMYKGPVSDMAIDVTPNAAAVSVNKRSLAAVSWDCNRLDAFGIGGDNAVWTTYWDKPSDKIDWVSIGGYVISPPAVVSTQPRSVDVFVRGGDQAAWVNHFDGTSWSSFKSLDGWFSGALTATSWGPGHLDVFGLGGGFDKAAYRKTFDSGSWSSSWEKLGGNWTSDVAAVSWGPGRIDIFAIGTDYNMYRKVYSSGSWASWENLGGNFNSPPTVVSWGPGRLDVFGIDNSGALLHRAFDNGGWGGWENLGGTSYSAVSAVTSTFFDIKRIDVFVLGSSQTYYRKTWTGTAWTSWVSHDNSNFNTEPLVASKGPNSLDVFGIASDNSVWHEAWNGTDWTPSSTGWENLKGQFIKFS